jgi:hypothetical protein
MIFLGGARWKRGRGASGSALNPPPDFRHNLAPEVVGCQVLEADPLRVSFHKPPGPKLRERGALEPAALPIERKIGPSVIWALAVHASIAFFTQAATGTIVSDRPCPGSRRSPSGSRAADLVDPKRNELRASQSAAHQDGQDRPVAFAFEGRDGHPVILPLEKRQEQRDENKAGSSARPRGGSI